MRLNPTDSLALSDSRHPITEMGIGKIIERAIRDSADANISTKFLGEDSLENRPAYRFEFTGTKNEGVGGSSEARKALIWVDRELKLPVRLELYDQSNTLLERHYFKNLRLDSNLSDKTFTL
jgi:outer membrane lipoprotein-sorting protein